MNQNHRPSFFLTGLVLALAGPPSWGEALPNPTRSINGNTAGGSLALALNGDTAIQNTGFGAGALALNQTGDYNTGTGAYALRNGRSGSYNTATGFQALGADTDCEYLLCNSVLTGDYNTATGANALSITSTGRNNTADGAWALKDNTGGSGNTAAGSGALQANTVGFANTVSGGWAMNKNQDGNYNTAVGSHALTNQTSGNNNIAVGNAAGKNLMRGSNDIYLANGGGTRESNTMRLGSVQTRAFIAGVPGRTTGLADAVAVYIDSRGQLGTVSSSRRFKEAIRDMDAASRHLYDLRPVTFRYRQPRADGRKPLEYGLIAEEVAGVYPDLVANGPDGQTETVQYHKLTPMLLNEVQRLGKLLQAEKDGNLAQAEQLQAQNAIIRRQTEEIADLKQQVASMQVQRRRIDILAARLARLEAKGAWEQVVDAAGPVSGH